jgi:hypothetical protein
MQKEIDAWQERRQRAAQDLMRIDQTTYCGYKITALFNLSNNQYTGRYGLWPAGKERPRVIAKEMTAKGIAAALSKAEKLSKGVTR